jgi:beta-lactam-binding protein with PASTA domain/tRNA A-37 threonylcarbamoyl transferase component Bud32
VTEKRRRVLNGRYEIDSVLGQGGMAKVFRGTDQVLGRTVAIKVLSPQFTDDAQFVTRFRREAQAAASLNHPNIVGVFDTGSQGDVHFIVMEYVEGRTLRDVIRADGPLLPERVAEIGDAVAKALQTAHEAGMVHRDIKPGNIMLTSDGEVKVMDFGIARTATGDTLTQTAAVLGTASYLSPEQAQGQSVDARSDLYSLGCVLYEMSTGRPPFSGDSPVAIAYKHVRDDPVAPSRINPDVPADLESVILKSMAKNPANRYQSAAELRQDLSRLMKGLPTLATPVMAGDPTEMLTRPEDGTAVYTGGIPPEEEEEERRRRRWIPWVIGLILLAAIGALAFFLLSGPSEPVRVRVPDVVGTEEAAVRELEGAGLDVRTETRFSDQEAEGRVFDQRPAAGQRIEEGSTVTIFVSRGVQQVEVPSLFGLSESEAEATITDAGLRVGDVGSDFSDEPEGTVIAQSPEPGAQVDRGSAVSFTVSAGPATVSVPDVLCQDKASARAEVQGADLAYQEGGKTFSDECGGASGVVIEQNPSPGTNVEPGTTVTVTISRGPEPVPTPTETDTDLMPGGGPGGGNPGQGNGNPGEG